MSSIRPKDSANLRKHGLPLAQAQDGEWESAYISRDDLRDHGEPRFYAYLVIEGRLHVVVFTPRGAQRRIISLRRANHRKVRAVTDYEDYEDVDIDDEDNPELTDEDVARMRPVKEVFRDLYEKIVREGDGDAPAVEKAS